MDKVNVAIIGTGNIAKEHVEAYCTFPQRCQIVAVCDMFLDKAKEFTSAHHLEHADVYSDYHEMLKRKDISLVSICLPPSAHCQVSVDCMRSGMNVVCEKPMASSLEEADLMNDVSIETGKMLSIISQNRYRKDLHKVKLLLESGVLGRVLLVRVNSMWYRGSHYYDLWWRGTWEKEGGGCTLNHSVHQIDILNYLIGKPKSILSVFDNLNHDNSEVEDTSLSILRYPRALAEINVSLCDHDEKQGFFIVTEKASISVPWTIHVMDQLPNGFFKIDDAEKDRIQKIYDALPDLEYEGHKGQIQNVLKAVTGEERLQVTGQDGKDALELIYAIYESATCRKEVSIPLSKQSMMYTKEGVLKNVPRFFKKTKSVDNLTGDISLGRK